MARSRILLVPCACLAILASCTDWSATGHVQGPSGTWGNGGSLGGPGATDVGAGLTFWDTWTPPGVDAGAVAVQPDAGVADGGAAGDGSAGQDATPAGDAADLGDGAVDTDAMGDADAAVDASAGPDALPDSAPLDAATLPDATLADSTNLADSANPADSTPLADSANPGDASADVDPACAGKAKALGCACASSGQCASSLCTLGPAGPVCSHSCAKSACPAGWTCALPAQVCKPPAQPDVASADAVDSDAEGAGGDGSSADGSGADGSVADGLVSDSGAGDASLQDTAAGDAVPTDAGQTDGGKTDAFPADLTTSDTAAGDTADASPADALLTDAFPADVFPTDAPATDTALFDAVAGQDFDQDGYPWPQDCNDASALVGPGALEVPGNGTDDDCDGLTDEAAEACDAGSSGATALDFANALGVCAFVKAAGFGADSEPASRSVRATFGDHFSALAGPTMAMLSSGEAVDTLQDPGYLPQPGTDFGLQADHPFYTAPKCAQPSSTPAANDLTELTLTLQVPQNAHGFSFSVAFFSAEYPEYVCTEYNDRFIALLQSQALDPAALPSGQCQNGACNISYDSQGQPLTVNNAFFTICDPPWSGPSACTQDATFLSHTGYSDDCQDPSCSGQSSGSGAIGGSTGWLTTTAPVVPGETITLRFLVLDEGDGILDSAVLLDNFKWHVTTVAKQPSTEVGIY